MKLIVRMRESDLDRLQADAPRFHRSGGRDRVDTFYEGEFDRDELDRFCRTHGFTCRVDEDGMGEIHEDERTVARVHPPGRIV